MENKAKEKAEEILSKFLNINLVQVNDIVDGIRIALARESALICVEEIIKSSPNHFINADGCSGIIYSPKTALVFWQEVKEHLNNMK